MKKLSILILCILTSIFGCKTTPIVMDGSSCVVDNTFRTEIINNSLFVVSIDGKTLKQGEKLQHSFPLMESELYDGWSVSYKIPLSKDVFYLHKEKMQVTNNQKTVIIAPPSKNNIREAYIVVKNTSKQSMRLTNGIGTIFSSYLEGRINSQNAKKEHNIAPSKMVVYEILTQEEMNKRAVFVFQGDKHYPLLENTFLRPSYIYTFEFNGKEVLKIDERPILKVGEPLWKIEDAYIVIEKVLKYEKLFYSIGKKKTIDPDGNSYYCPYISCMDGSSNLVWKTKNFNLEGNINDAVLLEDESILLAGESVVDNEYVGTAWLYSNDGTLQSSKNYSDLQVLGSLARVSDGVVVAGFDNEGILSLSKIAISKGAISQSKKLVALLPNEIIWRTTSVYLLYESNRKTLFLFCNFMNEEGDVSPSKLFAIKENGKVEEILLNDKIASVSCAVQSATGAIYAGGESTIDEKTEAVVLKIEADKDSTVLNSSVFYQGSLPFSYVANIMLDESEKTFIIGGVCKAKESLGVGGTPFISCFDLASAKQLWHREYKGMQYQLLRSFAPCIDYGFVASFSSILPDGDSYGSSILLRLTATGKTILEK